VGFGIPVMIDGPWAAPRIYPDVAGILDNPDAAYARLREMGTGLFAPGAPGGGPSGDSSLSDTLGKTLGNLLQQGLSAGQGRNAPNDPSAPAEPAQPQQGGRPMNDILRQLFGR
jgi:AsmA protein